MHKDLDRRTLDELLIERMALLLDADGHPAVRYETLHRLGQAAVHILETELNISVDNLIQQNMTLGSKNQH